MGLFDKKKEPEQKKAMVVAEKREIMEMNEVMVAKLVLRGDLSAMTQGEKVEYYKIFCDNLGLNPVTRPFEIITFKGKETLYARKSATDQLRKINKVSIYDLRTETVGNDIYKVIAYGIDGFSRKDIGTGVINIKGLQGETLANAIMKAETKAKRRLTLSLCGLGIMDESEMGDVPMEDITPEPQALEDPMSYEEIKEAVKPKEATSNKGKADYIKEATGATIVQGTDNLPTKEPIDVTESSQESPDSVFEEIMDIINGKTPSNITNTQKMETIKKVMPAKGNLAELKNILKKIE